VRDDNPASLKKAGSLRLYEFDAKSEKYRPIRLLDPIAQTQSLKKTAVNGVSAIQYYGKTNCWWWNLYSTGTQAL
jgi:hypothetical protein